MAGLVERVKRNLGERKLTGAVILYVAKAIDTVGVFYKISNLEFPSYLVKKLSSSPQGKARQGRAGQRGAGQGSAWWQGLPCHVIMPGPATLPCHYALTCHHMSCHHALPCLAIMPCHHALICHHVLRCPATMP
jgi:hypothetical protein